MSPELAQWVTPVVVVAAYWSLRREINSRMDRLESQIGELRERMAHLEGLLEGLREAVPDQQFPGLGQVKGVRRC